MVGEVEPEAVVGEHVEVEVVLETGPEEAVVEAVEEAEDLSVLVEAAEEVEGEIPTLQGRGGGLEQIACPMKLGKAKKHGHALLHMFAHVRTRGWRVRFNL